MDVSRREQNKMWQFNTYKALVGLFLGFCFCNDSISQPNDQYPLCQVLKGQYAPCHVVKPFEKPIAITRFFEMVDSAPNELKDYLPLINKIGYSFDLTTNCPIPSPICQNPEREKPYYRVTRTIELQLPDLKGLVVSALAENEQDGCSSLKFRNPRLTSVTRSSINFQADVSGTKRACGTYPWPFSGEWKIDVATGSGTINLAINLNIKPSSSYTVGDAGEFKFDLPAPVVNISTTELLGFINADSFVGIILRKLIEVFKFSVDVASFRTFDLGLGEYLKYVNKSAPSINYAYVEGIAEKNISSVPDFYRSIEELGTERFYFLDIDKTGFQQDPAGSLALAINQVTAVPEQMLKKFYYPWKVHEIRMLSDLSKEEYVYTVKKGDSLWKICKLEYGHGQFFHAIAHMNNLSWNNKYHLKPGKQIKLPKLWQLAQLEDKMVRPGDSLWKISKKLNVNLKTPQASPNKNKIYPFQIVTPQTP